MRRRRASVVAMEGPFTNEMVPPRQKPTTRVPAEKTRLATHVLKDVQRIRTIAQPGAAPNSPDAS